MRFTISIRFLTLFIRIVMTSITEITIIIVIFTINIIITITVYYYSCNILFAGYDCSISLSIRLKTEA